MQKSAHAKREELNTEIVDFKPSSISVKVSDVNIKRVKLCEIMAANLLGKDKSEGKDRKVKERKRISKIANRS